MLVVLGVERGGVAEVCVLSFMRAETYWPCLVSIKVGRAVRRCCANSGGTPRAGEKAMMARSNSARVSKKRKSKSHRFFLALPSTALDALTPSVLYAIDGYGTNELPKYYVDNHMCTC